MKIETASENRGKNNKYFVIPYILACFFAHLASLGPVYPKLWAENAACSGKKANLAS